MSTVQQTQQTRIQSALCTNRLKYAVCGYRFRGSELLVDEVAALAIHATPFL